MKAINLFSILSIVSICQIVNCTEENFQVYSIDYVDKYNWAQNFNYQNKDSKKYLFGIEELSLLVQKIQNVCEIIQTVKKNKNEYTLDKNLFEIITDLKDNSYISYTHSEYVRVYKGFYNSIVLINQFLILFEEKQEENRETVLFKLIKNLVYKLQDLNALSKVVEKLFDKESRESEISYYSYRIRKELENLHSLIKNVCFLNQIYSRFSYKKSQFFNDEKKELLFNIKQALIFFKNMAQSENKEKFLENARSRHKNNYIFFCEYHSHFLNDKINLDMIISTLDEVCRCKENVDKYLELLEKSLNKN